MKTVAVIFGGQTTEHDVSIVTALASIIKPLELTGNYRVEAIYITKDGKWYCDDKLKDIHLYQGHAIDEFIGSTQPVALDLNHGFSIVKTAKVTRRVSHVKVDLVFPAMHGTHGENGELMGVLELAGVPYVGCEVAASAIAMDKVLTKQVTTGAGIPTSKWVWLTAAEFHTAIETVKKRIAPLAYPLFIKPAHLGSSIGITRVINASELMNALEVAAHYDDKIIVEEAVPNLIEVTLPIIGNDQPEAGYLEQPLFNSDDFFDYETKYLQGGKKGGAKQGTAKQGAQGYSKIPADLPKALYNKAESIGLDVYQALGCTGIARVDMLIDSKSKTVYFNEVNPLPGSLYAHNWQQKGVSNTELVERLIGYAEERSATKKQYQTIFSTNFLKQF